MTMPDWMFRQLDDEEEQEFRQWARQNWTPDQEIDEIWHPVIRDECRKMQEE
jgi:hypothetical protein